MAKMYNFDFSDALLYGHKKQWDSCMDRVFVLYKYVSNCLP